MSTTELAPIAEESKEVNHMRMNRLDDSLFSKDLAPHYMKLAGQLASSEMVPKCFRNKPSDLFLCWSMGHQIGIPPEQAMNCIAVVNGKAVMWGDEMLALCMSHKDFLDIEEHPIRTQDDAVIGYVCTVTRKGKKPKTSEFTLEMAKKAGLLAKGGVWAQYPERMLKLRARGFCLRDAFPDALKGIKSREEVEDYIDADYTVLSPKSSRTELLKNDLLSKQGVSDVDVLDAVYGFVSPLENKETGEEVKAQSAALSENNDEEETARLHLEIKRLIDEKSFTEERITKALKYYEVGSIEALDNVCAQHFIQQLLKL